MAFKARNTIRVSIWIAVLATAIPQVALAQYGQTPGDLLDTFRSLRPNWFTAAAGAANRLFGLLALIEFAWTAVILVLDKSDLQGWTAALIRRMMFVGAFMALLVNGPLWIPAIIDSFAILGQNAAGIGGAGLSPGDVFVRGLQIAANLGESASRAGFFVNPASALALVLAAVLTFLAFVIISVHFIMALVESYVVVGAGFIFLGFGGSRWTAPYVERYIALAVAVGVKLMVLYMLIGAGMSLSGAWTARALTAGLAASPIMEALDIMGGAIIFGILCWQAPKFTASLLGGSPNFSGGDIAAVGFAGAQAGIAVATLGAGAVKLLAARGAASGGAMAVNQAAGMGAGGAGGSGMAGSSSVASAASGGQAGGAGGTGGGAGGGTGPSGKGSVGTGGDRSSSGGVGFGGGGGQPKPPSLGGGAASGGNSTTAKSKSPTGRPSDSASVQSSASVPVSSDRPSGSAGPPVREQGSVVGSASPTSSQQASPLGSTANSGGLGIATPVEAKKTPAPPIAGHSGAGAPVTPDGGPSPSTDPSAFNHGSVDMISGVSAPAAIASAPAISGLGADSAFEASNDGTLDSPQTVGSPMRNTSPMTVATGSNVGQAPSPSGFQGSFGNRPADQPSPPPIPSDNASLDNPQTITNPQIITSPMTNSSPMTTASGSAIAKVANAAEIAEQALDKSGRFTQGLRQALPPDGSGGGGPAQLNLHDGE